MKKVVVKISQGHAGTQTVLGGLTIYPPVANFLTCIFAKNYENSLAVDKVIAKISGLTFLAHPVQCILICSFCKILRLYTFILLHIIVCDILIFTDFFSMMTAYDKCIKLYFFSFTLNLVTFIILFKH